MLNLVRFNLLLAGIFLFPFLSIVYADQPKPADKVEPVRQAEWEMTDQFAQKALRDGEWSLVRELYQNTLKLALSDRQKARAYTYIGVAYHNEDRYHPALENLDRAIDLLGRQNPLPRKSLMAVLKFAAQVAFAANDRALSSRYTVKLTGFYASDPDLWQIEQAKDIYRHKLTGINFSEKLGEFNRASVSSYQPTGLDIGASYRTELSNSTSLNITTYATFRENQTLDNVFTAYDRDIKTYLNQLDLEEDGTFEVPGSERKGRFVIYKSNDGQRNIQTGMWLMKFDDWYLKVRATYAYKQKKAAYKKVRQFIKDFPWPVKGIKMIQGGKS